jgi:hypothetical protein
MSHYQHHRRLSVVEREEEEQGLLDDDLGQAITQADEATCGGVDGRQNGRRSWFGLSLCCVRAL